MHKRLLLILFILLLITPSVSADPPTPEHYTWLPYIRYQKVKPRPYDIQVIDAVLQFDDMPSCYVIIKEGFVTEISKTEISSAYYVIWWNILGPSPFTIFNIVIVFPNVDSAHDYMYRVMDNCREANDDPIAIPLKISGNIITVPQIGDETTACQIPSDTTDMYAVTYRFGNVVSAVVVDGMLTSALRYADTSLFRIKRLCEN